MFYGCSRPLDKSGRILGGNPQIIAHAIKFPTSADELWQHLAEHVV
jgi:hypothetical protein